MARSLYFIPEAHAALIPRLALNAEKSVVVLKDGFKIPGYAMGVLSPRRLATFARQGLKRQAVGLIGDTAYVILGKKSGARSASLSPGDIKPLEDMNGLQTELLQILGGLSSQTGYTFRAEFSSGPSLPPSPPKKGVLEIIIGASPPGAVSETSSAHLCGVQLNPNGNYLQRPHYVNGYGATVQDTTGTTVAQIVGSTLYLLLPTSDRSVLLLYSSRIGPGLFKRALMLAWNAYISGAKGPERKLLAPNGDGLRDYLCEVSAINMLVMKSRITEIDKEIDETSEKINSLIGRKRFFQSTVEGMDAARESGLKEALENWESLVNHPLIARHHIVNTALQVETVPLFHEHEGVFYRLGRFTIRYPLGSMPSLWAHQPAHPRRIAHPHVSRNGMVCFGNVTVAIQEAAAELRIAETFELVLRWLTEGYDPTLAETKIEEWPRARKAKK